MRPLNVGFFVIMSGAVVVAVCVYLDQKRHQDPLFRKKLRERRLKAKPKASPHDVLPRNIDPKYREAIIINEIQIAEHLMSTGELEDALIHFAHAISVCADPGHLLDCLYKTLPFESYELLINLLVRMYGDRFRLRSRVQKPPVRPICKKITSKRSNISAISEALTF